jgi:hypothetical protein
MPAGTKSLIAASDITTCKKQFINRFWIIFE